MKINISISNYVDTIEVLIDGLKIDVKKLSLLSKAEFEHTLEKGVHEIVIVKKSKIIERGWKKSVLFDWISCLFGVPDWTLSEKDLDKRKFSMFIKVRIDRDTHIDLKLTKYDFELVDTPDNVLDVVKQTQISEIAFKRIKKIYMIPAIILATIIELCMLTVGVFFVINTKYTMFIIALVLAILWIWLICSMILNKKK